MQYKWLLVPHKLAGHSSYADVRGANDHRENWTKKPQPLNLFACGFLQNYRIVKYSIFYPDTWITLFEFPSFLLHRNVHLVPCDRSLWPQPKAGERGRRPSWGSVMLSSLFMNTGNNMIGARCRYYIFVYLFSIWSFKLLALSIRKNELGKMLLVTILFYGIVTQS